MQYRITPTRRNIALASVLTCALSLTACSGGNSTGGASTSGGAGTAAQSAGKTAAAQRQGAAATAQKVDSVAAMVPAEIAKSGKLIVVMSTSSPPAHFETGNGMEGADADIANLIGEVFGLKTEIVGVPLDQILPGLQAKRYNLAISQMSPTAKRAEVLDFVNYAQYSTTLGVPAGNPKKLTPNTLCGQKVGVQKGSVQAVSIAPRLTKECQSAGKAAVDLMTFPESTSSLLALQSHRVDGVLLDSPVLGYAVAQSAKGKVDEAGNIAQSPVGVGSVKGNGLDKAVQAALQQLDGKGLLDQVWKQWGMSKSAIHDFKLNDILPPA